MIMRSSHGWQLILADLSLILFLVTLTALVGTSIEDIEEAETGAPDSLPNSPHVAPAQALFRKVEGGPDLGEWLGEQAADPRATLTIIAQHNEADRDAVWQEAQNWAQTARGSKVAVRVVITRAEASDLYASLAYDAPNPRQ